MGTMTGEERKELSREITCVNLGRMRIAALALLVIHIGLLYLDLQRLRSGMLAESAGYRWLAILHLVLVVATALYAAVATLAGPASPEEVRGWHRPLWIAFGFLLFMLGAAISSADQLIHGEISVYLVAAFGLAAGLLFSLPISLTFYAVCFAAFTTGITLLQPDQEVLMAHYINGTLLTVIAFIITRITYGAYRREFLHRQVIREQHARLERQAREDGLTGLYNRRFLEERMAEEFSRCKRFGRTLSIAMADIDYFKRVNDSFSHQIGDQVLKTMARLFRQSLRGIDVISRYGGEEFLIIFPETPASGAAAVCEKLRLAVECQDWTVLHPELAVTISIGVTDDLSVENYEKMIVAADTRLYQAKHAGRNRVQH